MGWEYFKVDALRHLRYEGYNAHAGHFRSTKQGPRRDLPELRRGDPRRGRPRRLRPRLLGHPARAHRAHRRLPHRDGRLLLRRPGPVQLLEQRRLAERPRPHRTRRGPVPVDARDVPHRIDPPAHRQAGGLPDGDRRAGPPGRARALDRARPGLRRRSVALRRARPRRRRGQRLGPARLRRFAPADLRPLLPRDRPAVRELARPRPDRGESSARSRSPTSASIRPSEYLVFEFWTKRLVGSFTGSFAPGPLDPVFRSPGPGRPGARRPIPRSWPPAGTSPAAGRTWSTSAGPTAPSPERAGSSPAIPTTST